MSLFRLHRLQTRTRLPALLRTFLTTPHLSQSQRSVVSSLQTELKTALRSKDKSRLTVLRALLAEITNASKTNKPINSDTQFFNLLARQIKAGNTAVDEFAAAKREDLVGKEREQLGILEEYKGKIDVVGADEIDSAVKQVVEELGSGAKVGPVMGKVMARLGDRPVDSEVVKAKVEDVVAGRS